MADNKKGAAVALTKHKSGSVSDRALREDENQDERVARTRRQLDAGFVGLLHRRAYANIRVADIAKKAGVGRTTFYAHYSSKDELLRSQFNRIVAPMLTIKRHEPCPIDATALFCHVQTSPRIYQALIGADAGGSPRILRDCFEKRIRQALESREGAAAGESGVEIRAAITTRVIASSVLAVLECWMESDRKKSPQELQMILSKLLGSGLAL